MDDLKEQIWKTTQAAIYEAVKQRLTDNYHSPLTKLVDEVVASRGAELKALVDELFTGAIRSEEFKDAAREQLAHKVAKCLMQKMEGAVEKASNTLRSDPMCRAKILVAIEKVVAEYQPVVK